MAIRFSTGTTPFDLVLIRPPPEFKLDHMARLQRVMPKSDLLEYYIRLQVSISKEKLHWNVRNLVTSSNFSSHQVIKASDRLDFRLA